MNEETQALLELGVVAVSSITTSSSSGGSRKKNGKDVRSMILESLPRLEVGSRKNVDALLSETREERRRMDGDGDEEQKAEYVVFKNYKNISHSHTK